MSRVESIRPEFVELIPRVLERGILYVSRKYKTASHLCCCGCGNKVVTPLKPGGWRFWTTGDTVTLDPSIGSWSLPCQSHYFIRGGKIVWAEKFSKKEINAVRQSDQCARENYYQGFAWRQYSWQDLPRVVAGACRSVTKWFSARR